MARVRNPLEPMSTAVMTAVTLIAVLMGAALLGALFADGVHIFGIGDKSVCVADTTTTASVGEEPTPGFKPAPGATVNLNAHPNYCTEAPSTVQSLLNTATQLTPFVFTVGALLLVLQLIRSAERDGLYTARTAERLRKLGWWLLVGSVLAAIAVSTAEKALIDSLSRDSGISAVSGLWSWDVPFMAILTGLGVLSFARIMRVGITMREDLDGTV
ncbi:MULTISPECIES: DUF2975 domain-containing protein [unclassified Streptomyces]|uniref:DUF2975 domain-containing protein n=1 Tax=unclassified Streptomyces TaxID=2593676 RepID=UPI002E8196F2|nr:DUF2975 domain-containing protein [Streptomyces sp. NBC_00589]WTI41937.1 DUF2975 domain-containing protein [Streptomyces sp. NBC_00775]WUB24380.1 DUF2975 domain-containing protein [Streptomyces sp. NBC_00589]